jgi:hypothetical protein
MPDIHCYIPKLTADVCFIELLSTLRSTRTKENAVNFILFKIITECRLSNYQEFEKYLEA